MMTDDQLFPCASPQVGPVDDPPTLAPGCVDVEQRPHLTFIYKDPQMVDEAMQLIIHHARRQASSQKRDKQTMKQLMRQNVQRFFHRSMAPVSDDEDGTRVRPLDGSSIRLCSQFIRLKFTVVLNNV